MIIVMMMIMMMMMMPIKKVVDHRKLEDDGEGAETEEAKDGKT